MNNHCILCKNFTKNGIPINITNVFSSADPFIVAMAVLDDWEADSLIELDVVWRYKSQVVLHKRKNFRIIGDNKHRFESYIKMAVIEYKKLYGNWDVTCYINGKEIGKQSFIALKPAPIYGNKYKNSYVRTNSIINITY